MATASCSSFVSTASIVTNYARLGLVTQKELPNILRELLYIKEPPHLLEAHLNNNSYLSRNLKAHEWNIIKTVRANQYNEFDVPLMYKIIRNLNLVPKPTQGWDHQTPPLATEITIGDDIERIRRIRNEIIHRGNINVQSNELTNFFSIFKMIASRLEATLMKSNSEFVSKIENVETCCIDEETEQHYIRQLHELSEKEKQLALSVAKVNTRLDYVQFQMTGNIMNFQKQIHNFKREQDYVIPKNIREQIKTDLKKWQQDDRKFAPTKASQFVFNSLEKEKENCITVVGSPGVGKTAVIRHTALEMERMGYTVIPITVPRDIRDFYKPGEQQVFVIDDICGNFTANQQLIDSWKQLLRVVEQILSDNCKIIVSCRSQVYNDKKFNVLVPFRKCVCNLISKDFQLSQSERLNIATAYLGEAGHSIAETSQYEFFPLLCFLCSRQNNINIDDFFRKPFLVFEKELNSLWDLGEDGQVKICGLVLCVIYNNKLEEKYLTSWDPCVREITDNVCEACGLNKGMSRVKIKEELDTLEGTYLKREKGIYRTVHDKLFDFLAYYCSTKMFNCLIENAVSAFIRERYLWHKLYEKHNKNTENFIIKIPDNKLNLYLNRLILDWSNGQLANVFANANMENEEFRESLRHQLVLLDPVKQSELVCLEQKCNKIHVSCLEACVLRGYTNYLSWIVDHGVDINQCISGATPLSLACTTNQITMVAKLINFGADVNQHGSAASITPLHVACANDKSLAVIHLLLKHNACINKQSWDGVTPLLLALLTHHKDVVKILLDNSADCNLGLYGTQTIKDEIKNKNLEWTTEDLEKAWTFWFAEQFPTSSVVEYVKQAGDQALYSIGRIAPLHVMCFENDIDMIALLLDKNPNINIRMEDGSTPLFIACQMGYVGVAGILLEYGACIDSNRNDGKSPLAIARQNNHSEIVCLLENPKWKTKKRKKIKIKNCTVS